MFGTETADVAIVVRAALAERHDVVRHSRGREDALGVTVSTQWFGGKTALALCYTATTTKTTRLRLPIAVAPIEGLRQGSSRTGSCPPHQPEA
jgi:hypothetical protein